MEATKGNNLKKIYSALLIMGLCLLSGCSESIAANSFYAKDFNLSAKSDKEAFFELQKIAREGNLYAQCKLAEYHEKGIGTPKDEITAFKLYKDAAKKGNPKAKEELKRCHENGIGTKKESAWGLCNN